MRSRSKLIGAALVGCVVALAAPACSARFGTFAIEGCVRSLEIPNEFDISAVYTPAEERDTYTFGDRTYTWSSTDGGRVIFIRGLSGERGDRLVVDGVSVSGGFGGVRVMAVAPGTVGIHVAQEVEVDDVTDTLSANCTIDVTGEVQPPPVTAPTSGVTTGPTTGPTTGTPTPSPEPSPIGACELLTRAEVEDVLGAPVTRTPGGSGFGRSECTYAAQPGRIDLLERHYPEEIQAAVAFDDLRGSQQHAEPIASVGDDAFRGDTGYAARVGRATLVMTVTLQVTAGGPGSTGPEPPSEAELRALFATAVSRVFRE